MTAVDSPLQTHVKVLRGLAGLSIASYLPLSLAALTMFPLKPLNTTMVTTFALVVGVCALVYWAVGVVSRRVAKSSVALLYATSIGRWFPAMWLGLVGFAVEAFTGDATAYLLGAVASILTLAFGVWPRTGSVGEMRNPV